MPDSTIRIRIDGSAASAGADRAKRSLNEVDSTAKAATKSVNALTRALQIMGTSFSLAYVFKTLTDFEQTMASLKAITRSVGEEFDSLRNKAKELGANTRYTAAQAAEAMRLLGQAGFNANEILAASGDVLALAQSGAIGLADAAEISAKALRGFRLEADQMGMVADIIATAAVKSNTNVRELGEAFKFVGPVASSLGVDIRTTSAAIAALSDAGISSTMAGTSLRRIMSELSSPTDQARKMLASAGISMDDLDIKARGLVPVLKTLSEAGLTVGDAFMIFGDRGAPAFEVLSAAIPKLEKFDEEWKNVAGSAKEMARIQDDNLLGSVLNLISAIENLAIQWSEWSGLTDALKVGILGLADGVRYLTDNFEILAPVLALIGAKLMLSMITSTWSYITAIAAAGPATVGFGSMALPPINRVTVALMAAQAQATATRAAMTLLSRGLALVGGAPGLALMGLSAILVAVATHESAAEKAAKRYADSLELMKQGAEGANEALLKMSKTINSMDEVKVRVQIADNTELQRDLQRQLSTMDLRSTAAIDWDRVSGNADVAKRAYELSKVRAEYQQGAIDIQQFKDRLTELGRTFDNDKSWKVIESMIGLAEKVELARKEGELLDTRMKILTGELSATDAAARNAASGVNELRAAMSNVGAAGLNKALADVRFELDKMGQDKSVRDTMTGLRQALGDDFDKITVDLKTGVATVKAGYDALGQTQLNAIQQYVQQRNELTRLQEAEKTSAKTATAMGKSLKDATDELNRLLLSDKEYEKSRTIAQFNELQKVLGATNPMIMQLRSELEKAFAAGFSSVKELADARTQFEEGLKKRTMGDTEYEVSKVQEQGTKLQAIYAGNAEMVLQVVRWQELETKKIRDDARTKEIDAQLQFWQDYMSLTGRGEESLTNAINQSLTAQVELYRKAGVDEAAIAEWVTAKRLEASRKAEDGIIRGLQKLSEQYGDQAAMMEEAVTAIFDGLGDMLANWIVDGEFKFDQFAKNIAATLAKLAVQAMILKPLLSWMGFADGGVFNGGRVTPFASGGVVNSPTIFPMRNGAGLMGEAGPEAIMPLLRMPNGRLGVEAQGGAGGGAIYLYNTNYFDFSGDGTGGGAAGGSDSGQLAEQISESITTGLEQFVVDILVKQQRPGGVLNPGL